MGRNARIVGMALGLLGPLLPGSTATAESMPVVVELFTSQGCSSCPPADQLLGELAKRPGLITLAYHIDYWDRLGWKDPFSLKAATARQNNYARALNLKTIYTPQMVIHGVTDVVGFDRPAVLGALDSKRDGMPIHLSRTEGKLMIQLPAGAAAEITVVAYGGETETKVARGENAGRILKEYSIVRGVYPLGRWDGSAKTLGFDLAPVPNSATMAAVLVQGTGQGPMLGAATIPLRHSTAP